MAGESSSNDRIADLMAKLGLTGQQFQGAKLGPGVVGRNTTICWAFLIVMLASVISSAVLHSVTLLGVSIGGSIFTTLVVVLANVVFGNKNPAAAILEGAQFVEYHQMQMAAKGQPVIEATSPPIKLPLPPLKSDEPDKLSEGGNE